MPTQTATPAGAQPISATQVTNTHVHLDGGTQMKRGEVRSLKNFERRLDEKTQTMVKVAEATRGLAAHAAQQAAKVTQLQEAAKAVKGGDKLAAALARLLDNAQEQVAKAQELQTRAARAAEAVQAVRANVDTRYGAIYQAVVDSPETAPAELAFYKDA